MDKPEIMTDEHLEYLDELRESGETNMFGAAPYLQSEYPNLGKDQAKQILVYWMKTFEERHAEV